MTDLFLCLRHYALLGEHLNCRCLRNIRYEELKKVCRWKTENTFPVARPLLIFFSNLRNVDIIISYFEKER